MQNITAIQLGAAAGVILLLALAWLAYGAAKSARATGFALGRESAAQHWRKLLDSKREANHDLREQLGKRTGELMALRQNIQAEAADHAEVERGLLQRLTTAASLCDEDLAVLLAIADKLQLAAKTFAGLGTDDKARFALHLAAQAKNMAERIEHAQANQRPHPDSELLNWLEEYSTFSVAPESAAIRFSFSMPGELPLGLRSRLRLARLQMQQAEQEGFGRFDVASEAAA